MIYKTRGVRRAEINNGTLFALIRQRIAFSAILRFIKKGIKIFDNLSRSNLI
jgi:hypothetical protein